MRAQADARGGAADRNATFGQRRSTKTGAKGKGAAVAGFDDVRFSADGGVEMTFVPSMSADADEGAGSKAAGRQARRKGVETFGAGLEKGGPEPEVAMAESERKGRTQRRKGMRSGSKNAFRRM